MVIQEQKHKRKVVNFVYVQIKWKIVHSQHTPDSRHRNTLLLALFQGLW